MDNKYINFYNNLVQLTRNKILYKDFISQDTFSDRLVIFLFHFAFFLNVFKQLETSIREIGYGDVSINKKMKNYVNTFYSILNEIERWEDLDIDSQNLIFEDYLNIKKESLILAQYFENYRNYLKKNTLNSLLKGVIKPSF